MIGLTKQKPANARREERFHIAIVSFWHLGVPQERGIVVAPQEIGFPQREVGFRPFRLQTRRFPQFPQTCIILAGQHAANVMFKCIETQRTLAFCELRETQRIITIV